jgi:hypothetical protein
VANLHIDTEALQAAARATASVTNCFRNSNGIQGAADAIGSGDVEAAWRSGTRTRADMLAALRSSVSALQTLSTETATQMADQDAALARQASR